VGVSLDSQSFKNGFRPSPIAEQGRHFTNQGREASKRCGVIGRMPSGQAVDQPGSRPKASTNSSAQGQPSAMRSVVRRADDTKTPAVWSNV
jgi:hypothetical protein